jgi:hypothetical protein
MPWSASLLSRPQAVEATEAQRDRYLQWWYLEGGLRLGLQAELPSAEGAAIVRAIEREAARVPVMPGEQDPHHLSARRADALVALCANGWGGGSGAASAIVLVHAQAEALHPGRRQGEIEGGGVVHPSTLGRLLCSATVQAAVEDRDGNPFGRATREPTSAMMRAFATVTASAGFPAAGPGGSPRPTTSCGGRTAAGPTFTT